jgi:hypothetical protein
MPKVNYGEDRQRSASLQSQNFERRLRSLGQPLGREEDNDQELRWHQYLEQVCGDALVTLRRQLTLEKNNDERNQKSSGNQKGNKSASALQ